jgi:hypothetical protein
MPRGRSLLRPPSSNLIAAQVSSATVIPPWRLDALGHIKASGRWHCGWVDFSRCMIQKIYCFCCGPTEVSSNVGIIYSEHCKAHSHCNCDESFSGLCGLLSAPCLAPQTRLGSSCWTPTRIASLSKSCGSGGSNGSSRQEHPPKVDGFLKIFVHVATLKTWPSSGNFLFPPMVYAAMEAWIHACSQRVSTCAPSL